MSPSQNVNFYDFLLMHFYVLFSEGEPVFSQCHQQICILACINFPFSEKIQMLLIMVVLQFVNDFVCCGCSDGIAELVDGYIIWL